MDNLSQSLLGSIRSLGVIQPFRKGSFLFQAGDPASGFYFVEEGEVRLYKLDSEGRELEIRRMGPGQFLGEIILFASPTFPVFAEASKTSKLLFFEKSKLLHEIDSKPEVAKFFLTLFAKKCFMLNQYIETISLTTIRQRLIRFIHDLYSEKPQNTIHLPVKKSDLALELGTISATLSRNLRALQDENLILVDGQYIHILNPKALFSNI